MRLNVKDGVLNIFCNICVWTGLVGILRFLNRKKTRILMFHSVSDKPTFMPDSSGLRVTKKNFEKRITYLKNKYNIISLGDIEKKVPNKVIITFDDGYVDNYTHAFPLLKKYDVPATIYLIGCTESKYARNYLTKEQIKEMSKYGVEFGSHTLNHLDLTELTEKECNSELKNSRTFGIYKLNSVAYPYGTSNKEIEKIAAKYYQYGIKGDFGLTDGKNMLALNRIFITNSSNLNRFKCEVEGIFSFIKNIFRL